jgi:uroporphyrinogen-III synthase
VTITAIVTRPQPQADAWVARLRAQQLDAVALPLIEIAAPPDAAAVGQAWRDLGARALAVFVSPSAAERFFAARPGNAAWPAPLAAAAVGPGTAKALRDAGVADVVEPAADAAQFDSEALWAQLQARDWHDRDVLIVRGDGGRDWLAERLRDAGARVHAVAAYSRRAAPLHDAPALAAALAVPEAHCWLFSSSEGIDHLDAATRGRADWSRARAVATHARIAERARALGIARVAEARAEFAAVVRCIQSFAS